MQLRNNVPYFGPLGRSQFPFDKPDKKQKTKDSIIELQ